ncbi:hypothetical protein AGLY_008654 [Aphis glycines]|uniref:Uncharacterized protein n=1 Tax=Aphis glycines TaxID=307491 RepID=A0A6G0TL25_APHGL|nr:hypothetical protein AGLY_008654 [Aphis glycines]
MQARLIHWRLVTDTKANFLHTDFQLEEFRVNIYGAQCQEQEQREHESNTYKFLNQVFPITAKIKEKFSKAKLWEAEGEWGTAFPTHQEILKTNIYTSRIFFRKLLYQIRIDAKIKLWLNQLSDILFKSIHNNIRVVKYVLLTIVHEWIFHFWTRKSNCSEIVQHHSSRSRVNQVTQTQDFVEQFLPGSLTNCVPITNRLYSPSVNASTLCLAT